VSITDFGIARATNEPGHLTRTGLVLGTAYYLPPEQAAGKPVTPASDLYALGVVAYECLTGDRPFAGDNAVQVAVAHLRDAPPPLPDEIPVPVRDLVMRLLAKDPDERPARASDVAAAARALRVAPDVPPPADSTTRVLAPVAATISGPADVTEQAPKRPRWKADAYPGQRRARTLLLLVGLVVIVVGAVGLVLVNGNHAGSSANTSPPTPAPSRTSTTAPSITLDSNRYVGRPFSDVQHDLITLGFSVQRRNQESDAEPDTVIAINPSGPVQPNSTVTVIVATGGNHGGHHGDGKGNGNND
jgi:serine/threonine-protein kinase